MLFASISINSQITYDTIITPNKSLLGNKVNIEYGVSPFFITYSSYKNNKGLFNYYFPGLKLSVGNNLSINYFPIALNQSFFKNDYENVTSDFITYSTLNISYNFSPNNLINFDIYAMSSLNTLETNTKFLDKRFTNAVDSYFRNSIGISTNINLFKTGGISILTGYEFANGLNLPNINQNDYSGFMIGLTLKSILK